LKIFSLFTNSTYLKGGARTGGNNTYLKGGGREETNNRYLKGGGRAKTKQNLFKGLKGNFAFKCITLIN
jgi:hypothetical protein